MLKRKGCSAYSLNLVCSGKFASGLARIVVVTRMKEFTRGFVLGHTAEHTVSSEVTLAITSKSRRCGKRLYVGLKYQEAESSSFIWPSLQAMSANWSLAFLLLQFLRNSLIVILGMLGIRVILIQPYNL